MHYAVHGSLPRKHILCILRARATLGYREKKNVPRYVSRVYYAVYIYSYCIGNDYYFRIIIEVAQLRQHKQRLNDLRMQLG